MRLKVYNVAAFVYSKNMLFQPPDNKNKAQNELLGQALTMFAEATGWIAFPVIGALFLGNWLDQKYGTEPFYFIGITVFAFIISSVGIGMTGVKYMKKIESADAKALVDKQEEALRKKENNEPRDK